MRPLAEIHLAKIKKVQPNFVLNPTVPTRRENGHFKLLKAQVRQVRELMTRANKQQLNALESAHQILATATRLSAGDYKRFYDLYLTAYKKANPEMKDALNHAIKQTEEKRALKEHAPETYKALFGY